MLKIKFLPILLLGLISLAHSQNSVNKKFQRLKIGDQVPDVLLNNLINYSTSSARLSAFKKKLIIIDFWNVGCAPCIRAFPEMEKLQKKFETQLQVLLVTSDTKAQVKNRFETSLVLKKTTLPFVIENKELYQLFPHNAEPFHVWLDENHKVVAITEGYNATPEHISGFLVDKSINFKQRSDLTDWNAAKPYQSLIQEGGGRQFNLIGYSSIIMKFIPNLQHTVFGVSTDSSSGKMIGFKMINVSLIQLFVRAYNFIAPDYSADRVILEIPHPEAYIEPKNDNELDKWKSNNYFCYESRIKPALFWGQQDTVIERLRRIMQVDLEHYFGIIGTIEKRKLPCRILVRTSNSDNLKTEGGTSQYENLGDKSVFRNMLISDILGRIINESRHANSIPFIDETKYLGNIDIDLSSTLLDDLPKFRKELNKYGLDIIEEVREINVLVLKKSLNF